MTPALTGECKDLLAFMAERAKRPLSACSRQWRYLPQTMVEMAARKPAGGTTPGMIRIPGGDFDFAVHGIEIEGGNDTGRRRAISMGRCTAPVSPPPAADKFVLYRPDVGNQRRVQEIRRRRALPSRGQPQFSAALGQWNISRGYGEPARDLGLHRGCTRLPAGPESGCRTNGNGNMPRRAPMAASIPGEMIGMIERFPLPTTGE